MHKIENIQVQYYGIKLCDSRSKYQLVATYLL